MKNSYIDALGVRDRFNFIFQINAVHQGNTWNQGEPVLVDYKIPDDKDLEFEGLNFYIKNQDLLVNNAQFLLEIIDLASNKPICQPFEVTEISPRNYLNAPKLPHQIKHFFKSRSIVRFIFTPISTQTTTEGSYKIALAVKSLAFAKTFTP